MANTPQGPSRVGMPPHHGRIDVILNRTPASTTVRCWINDERLFSNERHGGWAIVPAGRHKITCEAEGLGGFAQVTQHHDVRPGENIAVFYAPPLFALAQGRMGRTPQQRTWALDGGEIRIRMVGLVGLAVVCLILYLLFGR